MFKTILVGTDSLDACDAPAALAANLAGKEGAKLHLVHVLESTHMIYRNFVKDFRSGEEIASTSEYVEAVKKTMQEKCSGALGDCKDYVIEARAGFPWMEIMKMARSSRGDLIVLGPHRGKAEEKGVVRTPEKLGSTVEAIIMRAQSPVMLVSRLVPKERLDFKRLLFCTDFSQTCQYAFEFAQRVAKAYGSKLHVFHVWGIPTTGRTLPPQEQIEREVAKSKGILQTTYGDHLKGIEHSFDVWEGMPSVEIQKYARLNDIDLAIMGSHAREQDKRWYLGSVVEKVSLGSYCPVITVTRPEALTKFEQ